MRAAALAAAVASALVLGGCGGTSSAGTSPTPSPTTSASIEGPPASPTGPVPPDVPGYTVVPASESVRNTFQGLVTGAQGAFKGLSAYKVTKGSTDVGGLVMFDVDPLVVRQADAAETIATALVKTLSGASDVTTRMFGGLRVTTVTADDTTFSAWFNGDVISVVIGPDAKQIEKFVNATIIA